MSSWFPIFLLPFVTLGIPLAWAVIELMRTPRGTTNWAVLSSSRPHIAGREQQPFSGSATSSAQQRNW